MHRIVLVATGIGLGAAMCRAMPATAPMATQSAYRPAAMYTQDHRRPMTGDDYVRYPGAGVLFCRDENHIAHRAAAAWLIGSPRLIMLNAHNFLNRDGTSSRSIADCFFQIGGRNYGFRERALELGASPHGSPLHITDDWALVQLAEPVDASVGPQPLPRAPALPTGTEAFAVTMVSPAGHSNFKGLTSIEHCTILAVDPPSEDGIRRVRHNCNDGFGGSGSGLFDEAGHLVAMQSASLDMNRRLPFDLQLHYGSALLIEGKLLDSIVRRTKENL